MLSLWKLKKENMRCFGPDDLIKYNNTLANICKLELSTANDTFEFKYHEKSIKALAEYDVIMMRQDPPFNMVYITATHILEKLQDQH